MVLVRFLWGGLRPIAVRVVFDALALIAFGAVACAKPPQSAAAAKTSGSGNGTSGVRPTTFALSAFLAMVATLLAVVIGSGGNLTNRWTIVFPMIPFLVLQTLRQLLLLLLLLPPPPPSSRTRRVRLAERALFAIGVSSGFLLFAAVSLTLLFPAVELPLPDSSHGYGVGVVDLFLPKIEWNNSLSPLPSSYENVSFDPGGYQNDHFAVRVLYPTHSLAAAAAATAAAEGPPRARMPYLRPGLSKAYCEVNMQQGAPPPLKRFGWFVHYWNLIELPAFPRAPVLPGGGGAGAGGGETCAALLPMVVYSPGLGGTAETYSYQTLSLAARGFVVVVLEHGDGSLAVVPRKDGTVFRRSDDKVSQDYTEDRERHDRSRRAMTEYRSEEILAATEYMVGLNRTNAPALESDGVSFVGRLDINDIHYMGHSFGGASVLHAAYKSALRAEAAAAAETNRVVPRPRSIVAHDPVSNWIPDGTRGSLYDRERWNGSAADDTDWATPRDDPPGIVADDGDDGRKQPRAPPPPSPSVHDFDLFLLFSHQWGHHRWEGVGVLRDMQNRGRFGRDGGLPSRVEIADSAHHIEFSDLSMITPTWLARAVGMTGERSPLETAKDIHTRTLHFLMEVRGQEGFATEQNEPSN